APSASSAARTTMRASVGAGTQTVPSDSLITSWSLMGQPLVHELGRGKPGRSEWEVPPHLWRRGLVGATGFPPRERAEGERRSFLLNYGRAEEARRSDEEHADQEREDVEVCVDRPARKVARGEGLGEADQETAQH